MEETHTKPRRVRQACMLVAKGRRGTGGLGVRALVVGCAVQTSGWLRRNRNDGYEDAQVFLRERQATSAVVVFETAVDLPIVLMV
jgi:hypothetical protein